jgi:hypothetical protein
MLARDIDLERKLLLNMLHGSNTDSAWFKVCIEIRVACDSDWPSVRKLIMKKIWIWPLILIWNRGSILKSKCPTISLFC